MFIVLFLGMIAAYYALMHGFAYVFMGRRPPSTSFSSRSIYIALLLLSGSVLLSLLIPDEALSNRLLHGLGGVSAYVLCYRVCTDLKLKLTALQFFLVAALVVTALGVANELAEFAAQRLTGLIFATSIEDTWLDLVSNTVGIILAAGIVGALHAAKVRKTGRV